MLNATEYALLLNESYANGGNAIIFLMFHLGKGTNWQNEVLVPVFPLSIMTFLSWWI
jgi:hypothetical protein